LKGVRRISWFSSGDDINFINKVIKYCEANSITLVGMKGKQS